MNLPLTLISASFAGMAATLAFWLLGLTFHRHPAAWACLFLVVAAVAAKVATGDRS